jgi:hypothetical protein
VYRIRDLKERPSPNKRAVGPNKEEVNTTQRNISENITVYNHCHANATFKDDKNILLADLR